VVSVQQLQSLRETYPDIASYPIDDSRVKLAAGWLIDRAGWKGKAVGEAAVHDQQALVLTNPNRTAGAAVLALAELIQQSVKATFDVDLEMEPRVYP
jgi:UDP-N-acetylmuramate dehydrogenase